MLRRTLGDRLEVGWLGSQNKLTAIVLVARLLPFVSFDLVSYAAGLTALNAWRFALVDRSIQTVPPHPPIAKWRRGR